MGTVEITVWVWAGHWTFVVDPGPGKATLPSLCSLGNSLFLWLFDWGLVNSSRIPFLPFLRQKFPYRWVSGKRALEQLSWLNSLSRLTALPYVTLGNLFTSLGLRSTDALACRMSYNSTVLGSCPWVSAPILRELFSSYLVGSHAPSSHFQRLITCSSPFCQWCFPALFSPVDPEQSEPPQAPASHPALRKQCCVGATGWLMRVFNSPIYTSSHSPVPEKHTIQGDNNKVLFEGKVQDEDKPLALLQTCSLSTGSSFQRSPSLGHALEPQPLSDLPLGPCVRTDWPTTEVPWFWSHRTRQWHSCQKPQGSSLSSSLWGLPRWLRRYRTCPQCRRPRLVRSLGGEDPLE